MYNAYSCRLGKLPLWKGDISDFREMLAGYKSPINIALANANM